MFLRCPGCSCAALMQGGYTVPIIPSFLPPCPFWGVQSKQEPILDKTSTAFSKNFLPLGDSLHLQLRARSATSGQCPAAVPAGRAGLSRSGPGSSGTREWLPALGEPCTPTEPPRGGQLRSRFAKRAFMWNVPPMIAAIMKWYLNINDAHFFVNLESSCFWICISLAHTLRAALDGSAFILTSFQMLIPLQSFSAT